MTDLHRSAAYARFSRVMRPRIRALGEAPFIRCGRTIDLVNERWDLGHRLDVVLHPELLTDPENCGPEHRGENRSAGGRLGRARQTARARRRKDTPAW